MSGSFTPERGLAPVVGVALLVAVTVLAAALVVGTLGTVQPPPPAPRVALSVSASADGQVTLVHEGGDALRAENLRLRVTVDGTRLRHQPPVPFVGAPLGPFNARADGRWTAGERAGFRVAGTNAPALTPGARMRLAVYASGQRVAAVETTVTAARRLAGPTLTLPPRVRPRPPPSPRGRSPAS